jgi:hypothetical protein
MNYSRRPNRPDANYYRETRRRGMTKTSQGSTGVRRGRGAGRGVLLLLVLVLVLACAGAGAWFWFKK